MNTASPEIQYTRCSDAAKALGVSGDYLRRCARNGDLPKGSVIATSGGQYSYDVAAVRAWMQENYERQTRVSRMEAKAAKT